MRPPEQPQRSSINRNEYVAAVWPSLVVCTSTRIICVWCVCVWCVCVCVCVCLWMWVCGVCVGVLLHSGTVQ